jgi:N,N-dimethylformamidase
MPRHRLAGPPPGGARVSRRDVAADVFGYLDDFAVVPGASLRGYVSSTAGDWRARIVALDQLDGDAGVAERWGAPVELGAHERAQQPIATGSCVVVPAPPALGEGPLALQASLFPTLPDDGRPQGVVSWRSADGGRGLWLGLTHDGRVEATLGCEGGVARVRSERPLRVREWQRVTLVVDPRGGRLRLLRESLSPWLRERDVQEVALRGAPRWSEGPLVLAASACTATSATGRDAFTLDEPFDGKLARPWIARTPDGESPAPRLQRALDERGPAEALGECLTAAWDLGAVRAGAVPDRGPAGAGGFAVNHPTSAVTGPAWRGAEVDFRLAPRDYDALHFHSDDLDDARWRPSLEIAVPAGCASGLYGLALQAEGARDVVPFVVRPPRGTATARTAVWLPTYTWQAYANQRWSPAEALALERLSLLDEEAVQPGDRRLDAHPEWGLSNYDRHRDGTPCVHSSRRRPIANLRPEHVYRHTGLPREFTGDVQFLRWLRREGRAVDLLTDDDLHHDGAAAFAPYRAVVSGSHPEYVTHRMHCELERYVTGAGRLVYLAGNGLYWVTGVDPDAPHVIEVRRGHVGANPQGDPPPGEQHLATTGEAGGLWRHRGRSPQRVVGVGMTAMGWGAAGGFAWTADSADPAVAFVTRGIDRTQPLGAGTEAFPWGAACDEMDRADAALGTPPAARLLATSRGRHDERYMTVFEDAAYGDEDEALQQLVRADVVYAESPGGGRLFAIGSMGWTPALWHCADVERVTLNVLDAFTGDDEAPAGEHPPAADLR